MLTWNVKNVHLESVWIQLIFAENWKYYSKIIFKCVNSIVKPIFNEKVTKKWSLWDLWTMYGYIVHRRIVKSHSLKKKKKSANRKMPTHNVDPNPTLVWVWEAHFAHFPMLYFFNGFCALFTRPLNTFLSKNNFKTGFYDTIQTFKIYFITVFSFFNF